MLSQVWEAIKHIGNLNSIIKITIPDLGISVGDLFPRLGSYKTHWESKTHYLK
jgi:hypothetical protein